MVVNIKQNVRCIIVQKLKSGKRKRVHSKSTDKATENNVDKSHRKWIKYV